MISGLLTAVLPRVLNVIDQVVPDKDEANRLKAAIQMKMLDNKAEIDKIAGEIVLEEARNKNWFVSGWRPACMWVVILIIAWNFLLVPLLNIFLPVFGLALLTMIPLPDPLWTLMTIGLGGYIGARSYEKVHGNPFKGEK